MRMLTWRGWVVAILAGALSATITFLGLVQIRHWLTDEQQLHEVVALIQSGRLQIAPPPQAQAPKPPETQPPGR